MVDHFETVLLNMQYLHHYYEYLQLPNRKQTGGKPTADLAPQDLVITFEDVSFKYPGGKNDSLEHVNLTFHYGEKNCAGRSEWCRKNDLDPVAVSTV